MKLIKINDENYPRNLLNIENPPKQLYVIGNEKILGDFGIAIVGTRNASKYGEEITKSFAYGLAKQGINVISGLARGIDTYAHSGTILAKGKTIAVLGSGFRKYLPERKCRAN